MNNIFKDAGAFAATNVTLAVNCGCFPIGSICRRIGRHYGKKMDKSEATVTNLHSEAKRVQDRYTTRMEALKAMGEHSSSHSSSPTSSPTAY